MLPLRRYLNALRAMLSRSTLVWGGCVALALAAVAWLGYRARGSGTVSVDEVAFEEDGDVLVMHAKVTNGTRRRAYVYDKRALAHHFDAGSGTLTAVMHTVPRLPTGSSLDCHVMLPSFRALEPGERVDLRLTLPRSPKTFVYGGPARENPVPTHVRLELGWSDEPLTLHDDEHSLCLYDAGTRLQARERGIAVQTSR